MLGGGKLAGILLERNGERIVAGFGVNLAVAPAVTLIHGAWLTAVQAQPADVSTGTEPWPAAADTDADARATLYVQPSDCVSTTR